MDNVVYKTNSSTREEIFSHLTVCSSDFIPALEEYVDLNVYSLKIFENAYRAEAYKGKELIGLAAFYHGGSSAEHFISNVSVLPGYRGNKVASNLLKLCLSKCKTGKVKLEVHKSNVKAIRFYKKNHFRKIGENNGRLFMEMNIGRNYDQEIKDVEGRKYAYNFDLDVMHDYMMESFKKFFKEGNCLEIGSFKGDFTKKLLFCFDHVTCVEASDEAGSFAKTHLGDCVDIFKSDIETVDLRGKFDNIVMTHVLEHVDDPVFVLGRVREEWLSEKGRLFLVCPNANALSRQIAVKMGIISHSEAVTKDEAKHGHKRTYTMDTLESDVMASGLEVKDRSGIFFKALANFQWDKVLKEGIVSREYLDGCYKLGQKYPDLCASIFLLCEKKVTS